MINRLKELFDNDKPPTLSFFILTSHGQGKNRKYNYCTLPNIEINAANSIRLLAQEVLSSAFKNSKEELYNPAISRERGEKVI